MRRGSMLAGAIGAMVVAQACAISASESERSPYRDLSAAGASFDTTNAPRDRVDTLTAIRIGAFGPFSDPDGAAILHGIELALGEANDAGGWRGIPFAIVPRSTEGAWGVASRQVAALAFDDGVRAIIGGTTGHEAHLAELVAAKAWVPSITPWATDYTLDYANVPWCFRLAPDDRRQARMLWRCAVERGWLRIVVLTEGNREGRTARERIRDAAREARIPPTRELEYDPANPANAVAAAIAQGPDAVVVWGESETAVPLIEEMRRRGFAGLVLGPSSLAVPEVLAAGDRVGDVAVAAPFDISARVEKRDRFATSYRERYGDDPRPAAFLAYDAARVVVETVLARGPRSAAIREGLAEDTFRGLTGELHFGVLGGSAREPVLLTIEHGRWRPAATIQAGIRR